MSFDSRVFTHDMTEAQREKYDMGLTAAQFHLADKHDDLREKYSGEENYAELYLHAMEKYIESRQALIGILAMTYVLNPVGGE